MLLCMPPMISSLLLIARQYVAMNKMGKKDQITRQKEKENEKEAEKEREEDMTNDPHIVEHDANNGLYNLDSVVDLVKLVKLTFTVVTKQ